MSRPRSPARASASAGPAGTSSASPSSSFSMARSTLRAQARISRASTIRRVASFISGGRWLASPKPPPSPARSSRPASSASSTSPSGTMRGSSTARPSALARSASKAVSARAARRVGSRIRPSASESGSCGSGQPGTMRPASRASAKAGRKGSPPGWRRRGAVSATLRDLLFGQLDRGRRADVQPDAVQPQPEQAAGLLRPVEQQVERERSLRRVFEQLRPDDEGSGIDEGYDLPLASPAQRPEGVHGVVADAIIADGRRRRREQHQDVHARGIELLREAEEVGNGAVDPEAVGVEHEEGRVAEVGQGPSSCSTPTVSGSTGLLPTSFAWRESYDPARMDILCCWRRPQHPSAMPASAIR